MCDIPGTEMMLLATAVVVVSRGMTAPFARAASAAKRISTREYILANALQLVT